MRAVDFKEGKVRMLDQSLLPHEEKVLELGTVGEVADAIRTMKVRGAPAIGVAAAYGMALAGSTKEAAELLKSSRPTAVDLAHAVDYMLHRKDEVNPMEAARDWSDGNTEKCELISRHGATLIEGGQNVLVHCNTGFLAANAYGTALGAVIQAWRDGKKIFAYVDETRPRFQGALTSWELLRNGIPHKVIVDSSAGCLMRKKEVHGIFVGADRIVRNGDFANKIGTYPLAVLAKENGIPFYVLAPISTFDFNTEDGDGIAIEERDESEVLEVLGKRVYPEKTGARNLAFDVTPTEYVTAYVNEYGVFKEMGKVEERWKSTKA